DLLAAVWLLGALGCLTRAALRLQTLYACLRRARPLGGADRAECLADLAQACPAGAVEFRESAAVASPLTLGLWHPVILLPRSWRSWSDEQRALLLAHEWAHVRRRDFVAVLVAELARCLWWFHPLVRWLAGRLRLEQEFAADAWAASA